MGVYFGQDYSAMQGPAPDGFHVPLNTEWQAVRDIRVALGGGSSDGTNFGIALKLPFAGYRRYSSADVLSQGTYGSYWSSSRYNANYAYNLYFISTALGPQDNSRRAYGFSVRCFKNSSVVPTSNWTKLYGTSIEAGGIFWSSADGLISLSSDGITWITIADKNLGATTVWNSGDTLSETNCGKYYQWGNNYGFPRTGTIANQSTTQVDASNYGPGNYYSSDTFIKYDGRWDTTDNGNLRGGETGVSLAELKNAYIGEYIPTSGLLGYRPLQSDLKDYSGNENDGSWYSGTGSFGTIGGKTGAVVTKIVSGYDDNDTTSQHIVTTLNYSGPTVTICGWVYYNSMNSGLWNGILTNTSSNSNFISLSPRPAQSNKWTVGGANNLLTTNTSSSTGTWYFACGVLTSSGKKVYLNGSLIGSTNIGFTTGQGSIWRLGCGQINSGTNMATAGGTDGYIRHCAVYNRALTADEIQKFYTLTA